MLRWFSNCIWNAKMVSELYCTLKILSFGVAEGGRKSNSISWFFLHKRAFKRVYGSASYSQLPQESPLTSKSPNFFTC